MLKAAEVFTALIYVVYHRNATGTLGRRLVVYLSLI
jgi:hypothetical protein